MNLKTKLFELLASDRLGLAIDLLMNEVKSSDQDTYNTLILLKSRFTSNEKDNNLGIISRNDFNRSKAQIINAFQNTIERIPIEILESSYSETQNQRIENLKTHLAEFDPNLLNELIEKKMFLEKELIVTYDSEKKFAINTQINDLQKKIDGFNTQDNPLEKLIERRKFLEEELTMTYDSEKKFSILDQLKEIQLQIDVIENITEHDSLEQLITNKIDLEKELITTYDSQKKFSLIRKIKDFEIQIDELKSKRLTEPSNEDLEWELLNSNKSADYEDYHNFLIKYPDTKYRESAIEKCKISNPEKSFWDIINLYYRDNPNEFYNYLTTYPLGKYSGAARSRIQYLEDSYWNDVKNKNTLDSYADYLKIFSNGKYISEATQNLTDLKQTTITENKIIDGISDKNIKKYIAINVEKSGIFTSTQQKVSFLIKNLSKEYLLKNILIEISGSADHSINNDNVYKELFDLNINESKNIEVEIYSRITGPVRIDIKICAEFYSPTVYLYAVQDNPYFFGKPIEDKDNFYGRKEEINLIKSDIEGFKAPRFIVGEQRSGKSSILMYIKNILMKSDFIPLYLSLEHRPEKKSTFKVICSKVFRRHAKTDAISSLRWLLYEMVLKINETKSLNLDKSLYLNFNYPGDFLHNLKSLIIDIQKIKPHGKICLLIDEGNELINIEEKFQSVLRATLNELSKNFTILIACSSEFMEFVQHTKSSPFKNIFSYTLLRPFSGIVLEDLIKLPAKRFSVEFSEDAVNRITRLTGGHPYYVQALCSKCFDIVRIKNEYKIQVGHVEKAYSEIINDPEFKDKFIMGYWDLFRHNKEFIKAIKTIMYQKNTNTINNYTLKRLENRSLIILENNTYSISCELFSIWLKSLI
jgi:hypothetical protein